MSNMYMIEALIRILAGKGIASKDKVLQELKEIRRANKEKKEEIN